MVTKHAQWAVLGAVVKADGVKHVFVTALSKRPSTYCIAVVTPRSRQRIILSTRRRVDAPRAFKQLAAALRVARRLTRCRTTLVEYEPKGV